MATDDALLEAHTEFRRLEDIYKATPSVGGYVEGGNAHERAWVTCSEAMQQFLRVPANTVEGIRLKLVVLREVEEWEDFNEKSLGGQALTAVLEDAARLSATSPSGTTPVEGEGDAHLFVWEAELARQRRKSDEISKRPDHTDEEIKRAMLAKADAALEGARLAGDLIVAAFFSAAKNKDRNVRLTELRHLMGRAQNEETEQATANGVTARARAWPS